MWPATPRTVIGRGDRAGCTTGRLPGDRSVAAEQVQEVGGVAGPSPKRCLTSATAASRSQSGDASWPGRHGSSTGAGSRMVCSGVSVGAARQRAAAAPPRLSGSSAPEQVVVDLHDDPRALAERRRRSPCRAHGSRAAGRPGAQPGGVVDVREVARRARCRRSRSSPRPGSAASFASASATWSGGDPEQDHVVHDVGVAGQHVGAGEAGVARQLRVEQEAAVVVGADAGRRRGRVRLRHPQRHAAARPRAAGTRLGPGCGVGGWPRSAGRRPASATVGSEGAAAGGPSPAAAGGRARRARQRPARARPRRAATARRRAAHPGGQVIAGRRARAGGRGRRSGRARAGVEHQPVVLVALGGRDRRGRVDQLGGGLRVAGGEVGGVRRSGSRGTTSTWVGACGLRSRNATVVASRARRRRGRPRRRSCRTGSRPPCACLPCRSSSLPPCCHAQRDPPPERRSSCSRTWRPACPLAAPGRTPLPGPSWPPR